MEDEVKRAGVGSGTAGPRRLTAGKLTAQKPALKMKEVWSIRTRLELEGDVRNLVLFNLASDSKLRGYHFGQAEGWRCRGRRTREVTRRDYSEKDRQDGTVRDHGEHPTITHRAFFSAAAYLVRTIISSRAGWKYRLISRPATTPASFRAGWRRSGSIRRPMARTP